MARKNRGGKRSGMYARPVVAGSSTLTVDLSTVMVPYDTYNTWKEMVGATERHYLLLTPSKIRSLCRLTAADAVKITSIVVSPTADTGSALDELVTVDFTDGQNFICADRVKPTKCKPSQLSPAGRYQDAASTAELVKIYCGFTKVQTGSSASGTVDLYVPYPKIVLNVSVRQDASNTTLS